MKEVCGYKGLDGKFYETEKACKKADLDYKVQDIERILNNFHTRLGDFFLVNTSSWIQMEFEQNKNYILQKVAQLVLRDSDNFIEIINKKKELEKELDELQKLKKGVWWLKLKWW